MEDRATTLELPKARAAQETVERALFEIRRVIAGQDRMLERVLVCLLSGGHVLVEGVPGLAKTTAVRSLAEALGLGFRRIQFTPDLLPGDLIGTPVYVPAEQRFEVRRGPIFAPILLADEINRAPAKVQSALLEAMEERQVTIGQETLRLPDPFLVMATQNPIDLEGTYPLPEAQVDRFLLKVVVGYPARRGRADGRRAGARRDASRCGSVVTLDELAALRAQVRAGLRRPGGVALRRRARGGDPLARGAPASPSSARYIAFGASPRGSIALVVAARALALIRGRDYVLPQDVADLRARRPAPPARAELRGASPSDVAEDTLIDAALAAVPAPQLEVVERAGMTRALPAIERTPATARPGARSRRPPSCARPSHRRGASAGSSTASIARPRARAAARSSPRSGRTRTATTSGASTGTPRRAQNELHVRVDVAERAVLDVAPARRVAVDGLRYRRTPQGRRRRGRRARARRTSPPAEATGSAP